MKKTTTLVLAAGAACALATSPAVLLGNAAQPGTFFPVMGLGTGGYGSNSNQPKPECCELARAQRLTVPHWPALTARLAATTCRERVRRMRSNLVQRNSRLPQNGVGHGRAQYPH